MQSGCDIRNSEYPRIYFSIDDAFVMITGFGFRPIDVFGLDGSALRGFGLLFLNFEFGLVMVVLNYLG